MSNVKCFIQKFEPTNANTNATPVKISSVYVKPLKAIVRREGSRMVDNATFTFSGLNLLDINDYIGYLQDDISLEGLIALWNFSSSCRDESGHDFHSQNEFLSSYNCPIDFNYKSVDGRTKNRLAGYFNNTSVTFPNKLNGSGDSLFSLISDFSVSMSFVFTDMANWGSSGTQFDVTIFDKYDEGTDYGIKFLIRHLTNDNWKFVLQVGAGTSNEYLSDEYTTADLDDLTTDVVFGRTGDTLKLYVNKTEKISQTFTSNMTNTTDLIIGSSTLKSYIFQTRICLRFLTTDEISTLRNSILPVSVLKFYGRVWKVDTSGINSVGYCNGLGEILLLSKFDENILNDNISGIRNKNKYNAGLRTNIILTNLLDNANTSFFGNHVKKFLILSGTTSSGVLQKYELDDRTTPSLSTNAENFYRLKGRFIARGSLLDIFNAISVLDDVVFTFTPTGIITLMKNSSIPRLRRVISKEVGFNLNNGGQDKTTLVNSLIAEGTPTEFSYGLSSSGWNQGYDTQEISLTAPTEYVNTTTSYSDGSITADYTGNTVDCIMIPSDIQISAPNIRPFIGFCFGNSGTYLYVINSLSKELYWYELSVAYNLSSTVTYKGKLTDTSWVMPVDVRIKSDGTYIYILDASRRRIYQQPLATAYDINTPANSGSNGFKTNSSVIASNFTQVALTGFDVHSSGNEWYILDMQGNIATFTSSAWNIGSGFSESSSQHNTTGLPDGCCSIHFNSSGTKMWSVHNNSVYADNGSGGQTPQITEWSLGTAWNPSTINTSTEIERGSWTREFAEQRPIGVWYSGSKIFVMGGKTGTLEEYSGSTISAWTNATTPTAVLTNISGDTSYSPTNFSLSLSQSTSNPKPDNAVLNVSAIPPTLKYKLSNSFYGTILIKFSYSRKIPENYTGGIKTDNIIQSEDSVTSINTLGLQSRKITLPYFEIGADLTRFCKKFILRNAKTIIPRRISAYTIGLINDIFENREIGAYYPTKSIGTISNNGDDIPEYLQIKKIEYKYPDNLTTIELGDFLYDSFDLEKINTETIRGIQNI